MLGTKHTNLTLITNNIQPYGECSSYMQVTYLLAVIKVCYCVYLLKIKDKTIITTLQASSKTIALKAVAQSWIGL